MPCVARSIRVSAARVILCALSVWLASALPALAQATATLSGIVIDESDAVIPHAAVAVTNTATRLERQTVTSAEGRFTVPLLPPGRYVVRVLSDGFTPIEVPELLLNVNDTVAIRVQMKVATVGESVTVVPEPTRINTSPGVSTVIDRQRMETLPMLNRSTLSLAQLVPGVSSLSLPQAVTDQRAGPTISVVGSRAQQTNVQLDGATLAGSMWNSTQNLPSPDSIQEFKVLSNSYSAEYGRASGATLLAITKSGTNAVRGGLWEYIRNDALNATNFFAPSKPTLRQNQFGGTLGGPVLRDRTFYFLNYEGLRVREQAIVRYTSPTAAQRTGDFGASRVPIVDPATGQPFPGNQIPRDRLDPMALNYLDAYVPLPNEGTEVNTLGSRPTDGNQFTVKVDHKLGAPNLASVRWYRSRTEGIRAAGLEALNTTQHNLIDSWTISNTHVFHANLVGEGRVSLTKVDTEVAASTTNKSPRELGAMYDQDGTTPVPPNVSVSGAFGVSILQPYVELSDLSTFDYKMSWSTGAHTVRFGGQYLRARLESGGQYQSSGTFGFVGAFTGNAIADFIIGRPGSFVQAASSYGSYSTSNPWSAFVQDDMKLGRLTVNLGLRVERFAPWEPANGHASVVRPGQQSTRFPEAPPGLVFVGDAGVSDGVVPSGTEVSPRVGFAWDVSGDGRTAVRAAYGRFTTVDPSLSATQVNGNAPFIPTVSLVPQSFRDPYGNNRSLFPLPEGATVFPVPLQVLSVSPDYGPGHVDQFNVTLQRQIGRDLTVQAGYVGSRARNLMGDRQINLPVFGPGATAANAQQRRPYFPEFFGSISERVSNQRSQYDSLQVSATKSYAHGHTIQVAYTLSKSMDHSSGISDGPQNPADLEAEWGPSDFDRRHVLRVSGIWNLPEMHTGSAVVRHALGGWRLAGIVSALSGAPFNVTSGADTPLIGPNRGVTAQRPNLIGNPALDSGRSRADRIARYFDVDAFALPTPGAFGDAGRNLLTGPGSFIVDASITKQFPLLPGVADRHVELRVEAFNLFNTVNLGAPIAILTSPSFGRIQSAGQARVIQLGLRVAF